MHPTNNSLPEELRRGVVDLLQARLHDSVDLTTQAKQAHWNVKGPSFIALHELFDAIHGELDDHTDLIAERLVILGGQAHGTARAAAAGSSISEYPLDAVDQAAHVEAFSSALAAYGANIRDAIDAAEKLGDADTADLFTEISRAVDKSVWFVEAHASG